MRAPDERAVDRPAAHFERSLAALADELEKPDSDAARLLALSDGCARAFERMQGDAALSQGELQRARALLASALEVASRQRDQAAARLALTHNVLRAARSGDSRTNVGEWCDIAG